MLAIVDLPAPDRPVNQTMAGFCLLSAARCGLADQERLPVDIGAAPQPEGDHAGADRMIGEAVDDDERAGAAILVVGIEGDREARRQVADRDVVELERRRGEMLAGVDVDLVFDRGDRHRRGLGADAAQIGASGHQRLVAHPDHVRGELIGDFRPRLRADQNVAARDIELVGKRDGDGVAGFGRSPPGRRR